MRSKEFGSLTVDGKTKNIHIAHMVTATAESPIIPGLERETPEQLVRANLERAMFKYRGNLQLYLEKLMDRVPEPADNSSSAAFLTQGVVRRRTHK